jgi:hypothetical protein
VDRACFDTLVLPPFDIKYPFFITDLKDQVRIKIPVTCHLVWREWGSEIKPSVLQYRFILLPVSFTASCS